MNCCRTKQKRINHGSLGVSLPIISLSISMLLVFCSVATVTSAEEQEKEKELLRYAGRICLQTGNNLLNVLSDRQRDALFSPLFSIPSRGIRVESLPVFVVEPIENPRDWNAYAQLTNQGSLCTVLTNEMVKSLYQFAKIQVLQPPERHNELADALASHIAKGEDLGQLSVGLTPASKEAVDRACGYLASGLVAHEFAHLYLGHIGSALTEEGFSATSSKEEINAKLKKLAHREKEMEADLAALDNAIRVHPNMVVGMLYTYDFMTRVEEKMGASDLPEVLLDHPHAKTRVGYLLNRLETVHRMNVAAVFPSWFLTKYEYQPGQRG